jgi:hypothetical protein
VHPAIAERIRTDAVSDSSRHLGVSGSIRLELVNDRLMSVRFVPDDVARYLAALEERVGEPIEDNKQYHLGHDVILQIVDQNGQKAAVWQDADLAVWMPDAPGEPSQPAQAPHLGAVRGSASRRPAPEASDPGPDLGPVATSLLHGGAGWWKSPRPGIWRGPGVSNCPGLLNRGRSEDPGSPCPTVDQGSCRWRVVGRCSRPRC